MTRKEALFNAMSNKEIRATGSSTGVNNSVYGGVKGTIYKEDFDSDEEQEYFARKKAELLKAADTSTAVEDSDATKVSGYKLPPNSSSLKIVEPEDGNSASSSSSSANAEENS